jgi:glycerophosphoryl diester phosphodiesterase
MSFNPYAVEIMAEEAPLVPRGLVTSAFDPQNWAPLPAAVCAHLRRIPDYDRTGSSFISHEAADLGRDRVAELKARGAHVLCWTIRSAEQEAEARKVAEGITFEGYLA